MIPNDPILYGATLPYGDVSLQTPFTNPYVPYLHPWQRFLPNAYGFTPWQQQHTQQFPVQQFPVQQFPLHQFPMQQFPMHQLPIQQWAPYMQCAAFTPFIPPYNPNVPFYGWQRPFIF